MFAVGLIMGICMGAGVISCGFINKINNMECEIANLRYKLQQASRK